MMIGPKMQVGKTTEDDIAKLGLDKYKCPACDKGYDRRKGLAKHKQYCKGPGTKHLGSRQGQRSDSIIRSMKRAVAVAKMTKIKLNGEEIDNVDSFKYLGSVITGRGSDEEEVQARLKRSLGVFNSRRGIWKDRRLGIGLKIRLFKARVFIVLLYGSESWRFTPTIFKICVALLVSAVSVWIVGIALSLETLSILLMSFGL